MISDLRTRTKRSGFLFAGIFLFLFLYVLRLFQLTVLQYDFWVEQSERNHQSKRVIEKPRGKILDRNMAELALSVEVYTLYLYTREIKSVQETATILSTIIPMTREEILKKVDSKKGYLPIVKNLDRATALKITPLGLPGVRLEEGYKRIYPQKSLAAHLIGFCGSEENGLEGLELLYDRTLRGYPGLAVKEDISLSEEGPPRLRILRPPTGGSNIRLTIDTFIQHILETELAKLFEQYKPIDATAIAIDPFTGEILGMACLPNYDLNSFSSSDPGSHRNRPVVDYFEPGSCMKIFSMASALQNNKVNEKTLFYCRGYEESWGHRIKCHGNHGLIDINKAIAFSCNASMVKISQLLEPHQLYKTYRELGFGEKTDLEVPHESQGLFNPPSRWSGLSAPSLSIGQELGITGIQLVCAYSAIANGGWLMKPHLIKEIVSQDGDIRKLQEPEVKRKIFDSKLAEQLRKMLREVVETGTGKQAFLQDYSIGGKTSTAQKANPKGGYYSEKVVASFVGMAPAINPRIVLFVAANEPKGDEKTLFGSKVAAPYFAAISDRILKYLLVPPDKTPASSIGSSSFTIASSSGDLGSGGSSILLPLNLPSSSFDFARDPILQSTPKLLANKMPNFIGLTLKEVASITRTLEIETKFVGNGIAIFQNPNPGISLASATLLVVRFSPQTIDF